MTNRPGTQRIPRGLEFALCATALLWAATAQAIAGRAAAGLAGRFGLTYGQTLLDSLFLLFLVLVGFRMLDYIATRGSGLGEVLALPQRATRATEWGTGAAIGWGLALAAVVPVLVARRLHAEWNHGVGVLPGMLVSAGTLLVLSLAEEMIFRGYPFRRLARATSDGWAAIILSVVFALVLVGFDPPISLGVALVDGTLLGLLLAVAYLRTHALWLGWGVHFGYRVVMAVVLGLPIAGRTDMGALMDASLQAPRWLGGGGFGLDAAMPTALLLLAAIAVTYRVSREWSWAYTTPEITAAGYAVEVAPPAAHVAMEKTSAVAPPPLVQIMPTTPTTFSVTQGGPPKLD